MREPTEAQLNLLRVVIFDAAAALADANRAMKRVAKNTLRMSETLTEIAKYMEDAP